MNRLALVLNGFLGTEEVPELREALGDHWLNFEAVSRKNVVPSGPQVACPEALWLGMPPELAIASDGVLAVAELGADPPARSLHFRLQHGSVDASGTLSRIRPSQAEAHAIAQVAWKLGSKLMTPLFPDVSNTTTAALILESTGDLGTTPLRDEAIEFRASLPEGDHERVLRRFIDDSVNLLSELPFNRERENAGQPLLNVLWPSGHGVRPALPNLSLERGEPVFVRTDSARLKGLCRLVGYPCEREATARLAEHRPGKRANELVVITCPDVSEEESAEFRAWVLSKLATSLLKPALPMQASGDLGLTVLFTGPELGLALSAPELHAKRYGILDERLLPEPLDRKALWELMAQALVA